MKKLSNSRARWTRYALVAVATAMVIAPVTAYAADAFTDVPDTNVFHDDIAWMADNAITFGCGSGNFCPKAPVTREQMSAFMRRLAENQVVDAATALTADSAAHADHATAADSATMADDSALLEGEPTLAYTNEVFGKNLERDFGRNGLLGASATALITSVDFTAPADGFVSVDYYASFNYIATDTALIIKLGLDPTCAVEFDESSSYTALDSTSQFANASGSITLPVTAGTNSFALCGAYETGDVDIVDAGISGIFSTVGTATVSPTTSGSNGPLFP